MPDKDNEKSDRTSLVARESYAVPSTSGRANRLIDRIAQDALVPARAMAQTDLKFLIGDHEFFESDYHQFLRWVAAISSGDHGPITAEELVKSFDDGWERYKDVIPRSSLTQAGWLGAGRIREAHIYSSGLNELDLSGVPKLTRLELRYNQLTKLDLSDVPDRVQ